MSSLAQECSLFEIDRELDTLLDEIEEEIESRGEASVELLERFRQGRFSLEALCWDLAPQVGMRGSCLIEFRGKKRVLKSFREGDQHGSRAI